MSKLSRYAEKLKSLVPINRLPKPRRDTVLAACEERRYAPNEFIYRQGDDDQNLYFLLEGTVTLYWQEQALKEISADSVAARRAFDRPGAKRHSIKAVTNLVVAVVPSATLEREMRASGLVSEDPKLEVSDIASEKSSNWMIRLLQSALFAELPANNIQRVFAAMSRYPVEADQVVVHQGEPGDYYYVIEQGFCEVTRRTSGRKRQIHLADLKPGDAFGEEALIANRERGASVTMLTDGLLMRLAKSEFETLILQPLLKPLSIAQAVEAIGDETRCIDIRYPEQAANNPLLGALNMPFNVIRLQAQRLDKEYQYLVCGDSASQNAVGAFLLLERGATVRYLDGTVEALQARIPVGFLNNSQYDDRRLQMPTDGEAGEPDRAFDKTNDSGSGFNNRGGKKVSSDEAINRLESTIDRIDKVYLEKEQELVGREKTPVKDYAATATGKRLANLIDEMEQSEQVLNNGTTGAEDEMPRQNVATTEVDMDVTGGHDRIKHLSETNNPNILLVDTKIPLPAEVDLAVDGVEALKLSDDPIATMMREFEKRVRQQLSSELNTKKAQLEQNYQRKLGKLQQLAAVEIKKRQTTYKQKLDLHYKKKELQLRKHYHKLMALANKVTAQKAQLQDARRQFEDKLQAANALYKEVEDMRTTLKKHLGGDIDVNTLARSKERDDVLS